LLSTIKPDKTYARTVVMMRNDADDQPRLYELRIYLTFVLIKIAKRKTLHALINYSFQTDFTTIFVKCFDDHLILFTLEIKISKGGSTSLLIDPINLSQL